MGRNLPTRNIRPAAYVPTQPRSGNINNDVIYRMSNMKIVGTGVMSYVQAYAGSNSLSQTIATSNITGTVAISNGSTTVTGTGTTFLTELNPGQYVLVVDSATHKSYLLAVKRIVSATSFIAWRAPDETASGLTAARLPVMFAVDQDIGTQIFGNTIRNDQGTLFSVGQGVFRANGSALSSSLTVTRAPQISLYNSGAGTFTNFTLGMATPVAPTAAAAGGGTKGMQAGNYSIVITPARTQTLGYNNPSPKVTVTIATNDKINLTFPAMDTTNGQNAWGVWVTRYADSLGSDLNYLEGPWYYLDQYTGSSAGFTQSIEWLDAEVERNGLVTFNNDAPPSANFVVNINNVLVWCSCQGTNNSSPGPFIFPAKPGNIEAAPVDIAFSSSPPETILGVVSAAGRAYLLTPNHLEAVYGTPQSDVPVLIRPLWTVGFTGPDQVCFVNDRLYGHSVQGPARSSSDGEPGSQQLDFAVPVSEITDLWVPGHVKVGYDPLNNAVCYFHSANALNSSGFWTTRILMFGLRQDAWIGDITLSSTTQDMIVSGLAMVNNALYFLAGGRLSNDTISFGTYQFDAAAGSSVSYYMATNFSDYDNELRSHVVKRVRATAKVTSGGSLGVFGAAPSETIPVTSLETGNSSSLTGALSLSNSSSVTDYAQIQVNCPNLAQSALRIEGTYDGSSSTVDSVHELVIESASQGVRI